MKRIFLVFILSLICVISAIACSKSEDVQTDSRESQNTENTGESQDSDTSDLTNKDESAVGWDDIAEIELYMYMFIPPSETQHVEDAINTITEKKINTHVNLTVMDLASYSQQISMMMASGEQVDLMLSGFSSASYSSMMAQRQLMDISEYIDKYGRNITQTCGKLMDACRMNTGIYAIPTYRNLKSSYWLFMRKDVLEDLNLLEKAENIRSLSEFKEILDIVQSSEKWSYLRPFYGGLINQGVSVADEFSETNIYESIGDQLQAIYVENDRVELLAENESYRNAVAELRKMREEGYIVEEVVGDQVSTDDQVKNDVLFSFMAASEFGAEEAVSLRCGYPMIGVRIAEIPVSSEAVTRFCYAVPITAKEPEAAVAFMNLCYTDAGLNNLLAWGVEGIDYQITNGIAEYIPGNENPAYHLNDFMVPNMFLLTPWDGNSIDFYEKSKTDMETAELSPYLGFVADINDVSLEVASVTNVINEYDRRVRTGLISELELEEYINKLYSAGADRLIQSYQKQLNAWISEKE